MFFHYIGINDKILNLNAVLLIEDVSDDTEAKAVVTTTDGAEIEFTGTDAEVLFGRVEVVLQASDELLARTQQAAKG